MARLTFPTIRRTRSGLRRIADISARFGRILVFRSSPAVGSRDTASRSGLLKRSQLQESISDAAKSRAYFAGKRRESVHAESQKNLGQCATLSRPKPPKSWRLRTFTLVATKSRKARHPNLLAEKEIAMKLRTACAALVLV